MFLCKLLFFYFICTATSFAAVKKVIELSDDDFEDELADHEAVFVMFYAPWCGHCKELKPKFHDTARIVARSDPPVVFAKIDCTEPGKDTCEQYNVTGYPTLMLFKNGTLSEEYDGLREVNDMVRFVKSYVGSISKEVNTSQELENFFKAARKEATVVGFFGKDTELKSVFMKLVDRLKLKMWLAHVTNEDVLKEKGFRDEIVLYHPYFLRNKIEDDGIAYSGSPDLDEIENFVKNNYHGLVGYRTPKNKDDFRLPLLTVFYKVDFDKYPKGAHYWRNRILKIAKKYRNKINFAISSFKDFKEELKEFSIEAPKNGTPVAVARNSKNEKFKMDEPFSIVALTRFVENLVGGNLEPFIKSEPIPEINNDTVRIAVRNNFDEVVMQNGKDIFIMFHVEYCAYCQFMQTIFDKLAKKLENEEIVFVKMDVSKNELPPPFVVKNYPTFILVPKNAKNSLVEFTGEREMENIVEFLAEKATEELKKYDRKGKRKTSKKSQNKGENGAKEDKVKAKKKTKSTKKVEKKIEPKKGVEENSGEIEKKVEPKAKDEL